MFPNVMFATVTNYHLDRQRELAASENFGSCSDYCPKSKATVYQEIRSSE